VLCYDVMHTNAVCIYDRHVRPSRAVVIIYNVDKECGARERDEPSSNKIERMEANVFAAIQDYDVDGPGIGGMTEFRVLLADKIDSCLFLGKMAESRRKTPPLRRSRW